MSGVGFRTKFSTHDRHSSERKSGGLVVCFLVSRDCIVVIILIYAFLALVITNFNALQANYTNFQDQYVVEVLYCFKKCFIIL